MRFLFRLVIVPLLLFWVVRTIIRSILSGMHTPSAPRPVRQRPSVPAGGELKKDPVCGTYVSTDTSVTKRINGQTVYFCSPACRDKYRAA